MGSFFEPLGPLSDAVNELMLEAVQRLPIRVFNLTSDDLFFWKELASVDGGMTSVISTNLVAPAGVQAPQRFAIVEVPMDGESSASVRIAVLGFADPKTVKPNSGFKALDPLEALGSIRAQLNKEADIWIVIGDIPLDTATLLAMQNDEVYAVIRMERRFRLSGPEQANNAVLYSSVERGRYLGQLTLIFDREGKVVSYEPVRIELNDQVTEDPYFLRRSKELNSRLP